MIKEAIQKEIDRLRDEKNHLWGTMIVSFSGSITLLLSISLYNIFKFNSFDLFKLILCIVGTTLGFLFLNGYFKKDDEITRLIKNLMIYLVGAVQILGILVFISAGLYFYYKMEKSNRLSEELFKD